MLGGAATLFFEQYIFPDGAPMIILYAAMAFGAGLMIFGYGPKVWYLWWLKRQKPMTFDLQIVELSSLYRGRVGGVVTEPRPSQTRACAFTHSVLRMSVSLTARRLIA